MKQLLQLLCTFSFIINLNAQTDKLWVELESPFNSNMEILGIFDNGVMLGKTLYPVANYYSDDDGQSWKPLCDGLIFRRNEFSSGFVLGEDQKIYYGDFRSIRSLDLVNGLCTELIASQSMDLRIFADSDLLVFDNDILKLYSDSGLVKEIQLGNERVNGQLLYEEGYPSYMIYKNWSGSDWFMQSYTDDLVLGVPVSIPNPAIHDFHYSQGIVYSSTAYSADGGNSWTSYDNLPQDDISRLFIDEQSAIYLVGVNGLYKSTNKGASFEKIQLPFPLQADDVYLYYSKNAIVISAESCSDNRALISKDGGSTFTQINTDQGLPSSYGIAAGRNENVFSKNCGGSGRTIPYSQYLLPQSTTWSALDDEHAFINIKALPNDDILAAGTKEICISKDKGQTWSCQDFQGRIPESILECKGTKIFAFADEDKVFISDDGGQNFRELNIGYKNPRALSFLSSEKALYTDLEGKYVYLSDLNTQTDTRLDNNFKGFVSGIQTSNTGQEAYVMSILSALSEVNAIYLYTTKDEGQTFTEKKIDIELPGSIFSYQLYMNHRDQLFIYGEDNLFFSSDLGESWLDLAPLLPAGAEIYDIDYSYDDYLYLAVEGRAPLKSSCQLFPVQTFQACADFVYDKDGDGYNIYVDCDDNNSNVNPVATEVPYNGLDDDCNPSSLDDDLDQDGFVLAQDCDDNNAAINPFMSEIPYNGIDDDCNPATFDNDLDEDGFLLANDCNDSNPNVNPNATEIPYNGEDDDCNASTLDDDLDQDGYLLANDCNDNNSNVNPASAELTYNGIDDDCNPATRDDDLDQDGFVLANDCNDNNPNVNPSTTEIPYNGLDDDCNAMTRDDDLDQDGYLLANDCNDNNPNVNPAIMELIYNGIDDDCNPATRDDDLDQDGFNFVNDCNDNNPNVNPGMTEIPNNGIDDDCNPATLDASGGVDLDGDGYNTDSDCDDNNPNINPGLTEVAYNGIDDDCNPATRDDDLDQDGFALAQDCDDNNASINPSASELSYNGVDDDCDPTTPDDDLDQDGYGFAEDCNEGDPNINPGMTEIPNNGIDDDCNSATPDVPAIDVDGDGYGPDSDCDDNNPNINPGITEVAYNGIDDDCNPATRDDDLDQDGFVLAQDCDDNNASINPSASELSYNGVDDDCDPTTPDDDLDQDGYGFAEDCNEGDPNINPGMTEIPNNGIDDDCNPATSDTPVIVDTDGDGYNSDIDCDDNNAAINPGANELVYNGIDDDCDPATRDDDIDQDGYLISEDCDDNNPDIYPGALEIPNNGIDEDCDGIDAPDSTDDQNQLELKVYPNPFTVILFVETSAALNYQVSLFDIQGRLVFKAKNVSTINLSVIQPGSFILELQDLDSGFRTLEKLIKI